MNNPLSNCCGSHPLGEIHNNFAYCSDCKEMAEFSDDDEDLKECSDAAEWSESLAWLATM